MKIWMMTGKYWLVVEPYPSEKYEFVSRDDDIPNIWKNNPVPNHQPVLYVLRGKCGKVIRGIEENVWKTIWNILELVMFYNITWRIRFASIDAP